MFGHVSVVITFNEESEFSWGIWRGNGGIGTNDGLSFGVVESIRSGGLHEETGGDGNKRGIIIRQLEHETRNRTMRTMNGETRGSF